MICIGRFFFSRRSPGDGAFQAYLGGQAGIFYAIEASPNLRDWSPLLALTIPNLTTPFNDTNTAGAGARFYRAKGVSADFAPASIAGQALKGTITEGGGQFVTNGLFQWFADANGNAYQFFEGPGLTNSAGTYSYAKTASGSAAIAAADAQSGTNYFNLVFTAPDTGFYYQTNPARAGFQAGSFTLAHGPVAFFGNIHFNPDSVRAASLSFPADGNPASLSVTNASGYVWTLTLPADALLTPRTITMTPFASVDSISTALPVTTGVLLEPDGMQFKDGVALTLTTPTALGAHASLMLSGGDGSDVRLVATTNQANSYSTTLFHFSSGAVTDPSDQQVQALLAKLALVKQAYNQAKSDILALESGTDPIPPPPPDSELTCGPPGSAPSELDRYMANVFAKIDEVLGRLISTARTLELFGDPQPDAGSIFLRAVETLMFRMVDSLISLYGSDPDKVVNVATIALRVSRLDLLNDGSGGPPSWWSLDLASGFAAAGAKVLSKLTDEHDYSMATVILGILNDMQFFGIPNDGSLMADLLKAMTFKFSVDISLSGVFGSKVSYSSEAAGDVMLTLSSGSLRGSGTVNYLSGSTTPATLLAGQSFVMNPTVTLDACTNLTATALFPLASLGSRTETWLAPAPIGQFVDPLMIVNFGIAFADHKTTNLTYSFTVPLLNRQAQAVNQTIRDQGANNGAADQGTLRLLLLHTPQ